MAPLLRSSPGIVETEDGEECEILGYYRKDGRVSYWEIADYCTFVLNGEMRKVWFDNLPTIH